MPGAGAVHHIRSGPHLPTRLASQSDLVDDFKIRHLDRLREGRPESIETTSLHLDVLRDLRRIHSHICSVAYPVLEAAGEFAEPQSTERGPIELPSITTHPSVSNVGHS